MFLRALRSHAKYGAAALGATTALSYAHAEPRVYASGYVHGALHPTLCARLFGCVDRLSLAAKLPPDVMLSLSVAVWVGSLVLGMANACCLSPACVISGKRSDAVFALNCGRQR